MSLLKLYNLCALLVCCNFQSPLYVSPLFCWVLWPFLKIIHYAIQIASLHNPGNLVVLSMTLQKAHIAWNWAAGHDISPLDPLSEIPFCFSSIPDLCQAWTIPFRVLNLNILKYQILLSHNYSEKNLEILSERFVMNALSIMLKTICPSIR
jgi:hypothetical protein